MEAPQSFRLEFDTDYGIDKRTGWTVTVNGSILCELVPFEQAMRVALEQMPSLRKSCGSTEPLQSIRETCRDTIAFVKAQEGRPESDLVWARAMLDSRLHLLWDCVQLIASAPLSSQEVQRRYLNDARFNSIVTVLEQFMRESEVSAEDVRQALLVVDHHREAEGKRFESFWEQFIAVGKEVVEPCTPPPNAAAIAQQIADESKPGQIVGIPDERFDLVVAEVKDGTPVCYCPFCGHASMCLKEGPADHGRGLYYCNRGCTPTPRVPTGFDFGGNRELFEASLSQPAPTGSIIGASWSHVPTQNILDDLRQIREQRKGAVLQPEMPDPFVVQNMLAAVEYGRTLKDEGNDDDLPRPEFVERG